MSTVDQKRTLEDAMREALAFRALFSDMCYQHWFVAGSIRRAMPFIGDVEHVIIPRFDERPDPEHLFGEPKPFNAFMERLDELEATGAVAKHVYQSKDGKSSNRWGQRYRGCDFRGMTHEVFMADHDNLGSVLAIRTGPGSYSRMLVTQLQRHGYLNYDGYVWNKSAMKCTCGWSGSDRKCRWETPESLGLTNFKGFVKDPDGRDGGPYLAVCPSCFGHSDIFCERLSVGDERRYFELCGVPWTEPSARREIL